MTNPDQNIVFPLGQIKRDLRNALEKIEKLKASAGEETTFELGISEATISTAYRQLDELQRLVDEILTREIEQNTILYRMKSKTDKKPEFFGRYSI